MSELYCSLELTETRMGGVWTFVQVVVGKKSEAFYSFCTVKRARSWYGNQQLSESFELAYPKSWVNYSKISQRLKKFS